MPNRIAHEANLAIPTLMDDHLELGGLGASFEADLLDERFRGPAAMNEHAAAKPRQCLVVHVSLHDHHVLLLHAETRVGQAIGEVAVVGADQ